MTFLGLGHFKTKKVHVEEIGGGTNEGALKKSPLSLWCTYWQDDGR